jgi:hypothetical protein
MRNRRVVKIAQAERAQNLTYELGNDNRENPFSRISH